jgi:transcriptional regulator with XRE-family HTH domain
MTTGQKVREARKSAGLSSDQLAELIGISQGAITKIERDDLKFGPNPDLVVKIADVLNDKSILTTYLENNPAYQAIIPKIFTDLNNIKRDPAIIFSRFATEAEEAVEAARILAQIFSNAEPANHPFFCETLYNNLEQIVGIQRCAEIIFLQLIASGVISDADRCEIHSRQQRKCIERGHHKPERNGTEG